VERDNNISNRFDHSVPPMPLSVGGIFYVCSSTIHQPFGAAVAPFHLPFAHGMPALSVVAKFAATYSPRSQMPLRSQDPAAFIVTDHKQFPVCPLTARNRTDWRQEACIARLVLRDFALIDIA
jgi:hypothetical protein